MYIPAVALMTKNAEYIRDQRAAFKSGRPPPDFPGGVGERDFVNRGTADDLVSPVAKAGYVASLRPLRMQLDTDYSSMGMIPFPLDSDILERARAVRRAA
jgi:hypothetical protein